MIQFFKWLKRKILRILGWLFQHFYDRYSGHIVYLRLSAKTDGNINFKGKHMAITIRNDQQVAFEVTFEDAFGNVVTALGSEPEWAVSDAELAVITTEEKGLKAVVKPTGKTGVVTVTVKVDADPAEAVDTIVGQAEIEIVAGKAKIIRLQGVIADQVPASQPEQPAEGEPGQESPEQPQG